MNFNRKILSQVCPRYCNKVTFNFRLNKTCFRLNNSVLMFYNNPICKLYNRIFMDSQTSGLPDNLQSVENKMGC